MALLSQLLGNRELTFEDNLEKGRIWVYSDGNMYSGFCNNWCWQAPGCGKVIIEAWGAAGSGAEMCCCGTGLPGNAPAYTKKCICVCLGNYICGYIGRSCNNADDLCFRGCSEATCVCWFGCSPTALYQDGVNPNAESSWKGNNPWGWGDSWGMPGDYNTKTRPESGFTKFSNASDTCCAAGMSRGCLCAQGGRGGLSYCMDTKSAYSCFVTNYHCGNRVGQGHDMCAFPYSACGRICNWCSNCAGFIACSYGGDINCCGGWSCVDFLGCLQTCPCQFLHHVTTAAGVYATEGATISFYTDGDSHQQRWSGGPQGNLISAIPALSRQPSHASYGACWVGATHCGCYNMHGCMNFMPYGMPGAGPQPCGDVRDHAARGGMGMVRIKYIPTDGGDGY